MAGFPYLGLSDWIYRIWDRVKKDMEPVIWEAHILYKELKEFSKEHPWIAGLGTLVTLIPGGGLISCLIFTGVVLWRYWKRC